MDGNPQQFDVKLRVIYIDIFRNTTYFILIDQGHAYTLGVPARYGNFAPGEAVPYASAQAILSHLGQCAEVEYYHSVTVHDLKEVVPKTLPKSALAACQCGCGELLRLGPSQRAGGAPPKFHECVAKTGEDGRIVREKAGEAGEGRSGNHQGYQLCSGAAAGGCLPAASVSPKAATRGEAVFRCPLATANRKVVHGTASRSYKEALCKGLGAVAVNNGAAREGVQWAAAKGSGDTVTCTGTQEASRRHQATEHGGRTDLHIGARPITALMAVSSKAALRGGGACKDGDSRSAARNTAGADRAACTPAASGSPRAAAQGRTARRRKAEGSGSAVLVSRETAGRGGNDYKGSSGTATAAAARRRGRTPDRRKKRWHGTWNHAKSGYGGEKGSEGGGGPPRRSREPVRESPGERDRGETWDLRRILGPKPSLFLDRRH